MLTCIQSQTSDLIKLSEVTRFKKFAVSEASVPAIALNNCWIISDVMLKALECDPSVLNTSYDTMEVSGILTPAGCHYGLLVRSGEQGVVIDFSARQFDPEVSMPLIMDMWEWQEWCEQKIGRQGEWSHEEGWWG